MKSKGLTPQQFHFSTSSCQRITHLSIDKNAGKGSLTVQSDLTHPKLFPAVTGHLINDVPMLPSAIYADMAMTAAEYLYRNLRPDEPNIGLNVCAIEVHKPVIAQTPPPEEGQHIQMEANANLQTGVVELTFWSVTWDGDRLQDHCRGLVKYEDPSQWTSEWERVQFLVETQISTLEDKLDKTQAHKFLRGLAYKLFQALVNYSPKYQGMKEVIMDGYEMAATAKVQFQTTGQDGDFFCSPYYIDNLCHLTGFLVNASDLSNPDLTYISHGWKSFKIPKPREISADKEYRCYVKMLPQKANVVAGDVYVIHDGEIVCVFYGCKFQGIPKRAMSALLPSSMKYKAS